MEIGYSVTATTDSGNLNAQAASFNTVWRDGTGRQVVLKPGVTTKGLVTGETDATCQEGRNNNAQLVVRTTKVANGVARPANLQAVVTLVLAPD